MPSAKTSPKASSKSSNSPALPAGTVFHIPLTDPKCTGHVAGIISRPPNSDTNLVHAYLRLELLSSPPNPKTLGHPTTWPSTWLGLLSTKPLTTNRWHIAGPFPDFNPTDFPIPPVRQLANLWSVPEQERHSIETVPDEPSMSPIASDPATADEAAQFPELNVIIAASNLEKSLVRLFRNMGFTFNDIPITGQTISKADLTRWTKHNTAARAAAPDASHLLPPGSHTDRNAKPGDLFAFPFPGGGFGAALLVHRPDKHQRVFADTIVLSFARRWSHYPTLSDLAQLGPGDACYLSQMSFIEVLHGRWRALGPHPHYRPEDYPLPTPWFEPHTGTPDPKQALIRLHTGPGEYRYAYVPRAILNLDPKSSRVLASSSSGHSIAERTLQHLEKIPYPPPSPTRFDATTNLVTPSRLAAWKTLNTELQSALPRATPKPENAKKLPLTKP